MPHPTQQPKAGRQVERIREILVGRQMDAIEQRLLRLEKQMQPMPVDAPPSTPAESLEAMEKRQQETLCRMRDEIDADRLRQLDETRRLAQQIQSVARARTNSEQNASRLTEQRMAEWFGRWEQGLARHLKEREEFLIRELRAELDRMRDWIRREMSQGGGGQPDMTRMKGAFEQLATATRSIIDSIPAGPTDARP
jgi:hypothetical protein